MQESQSVEYKTSWRDEYLKWICGYANADGGILYIGKDDQGRVVPVANAKKLLEDIPNKVRDSLGIIVDVNLRTAPPGDYLEIIVEPYPYPVSYKGQYHYRSGSTKQELKGAALDRFLLRKQGRHWDGVPVPRVTVADFDRPALQLFRDKAAKSGRTAEDVLREEDAVLLEHLQLTEGAYFKRASVLLFHNHPEKYITGAYVKIGFFHSNDDLRYQDEVHGHLFAQIEKTIELLHTKYLKAYIHYEGIHRIEQYLFPPAALREALLNALVHKDYNFGVPVQISVYEDHLVFWNPGTLPENWTLDKLFAKHPSVPFNPLLANAFFRAGYIEAWGRGIEKIVRECREHGLNSPEYDISMSGLMLTFQANPQYGARAPGLPPAGKTTEKLGERLGEKLGKTRAAIVQTMQTNPQVTITQLAERLALSATAIEKNIRLLKTQGYVQRIGPARGGHWEVRPDEHE